MSKYTQFAQIKNKKFKINTDFRIALRCNQIAENGSISDEERALAIIFLLFGEEGLQSEMYWVDLLKIALKFLRCGKDAEEDDKEEVDMDLQQDWSYIQTSFFSDYAIDLNEKQMHWWQFHDLLCGLTDKCVLSRIRYIRSFDVNQIKDSREREKWIKQKNTFSLDKKIIKTAEEIRLDELFERQLKGE